MKALLSKFLLCLIPLASINAQADFELGLNYYKKADFSNAFREFLESAQYGDHDAQHNLGVMYYRGEHVGKDLALAYAWMAIAAQANSYKESGLYLRVFNKLSEQEKLVATQKFDELFVKYSEEAIEKKLTPIYTGEESQLMKERPIREAKFEWPNMFYRGKGGFIDVFYSVDKRGITRDHVIFHTFSDNLGKAFVNSLRKSLYEPLKIEGTPAYVTGLKKRLIIFIDSNQVDEVKLSQIALDLKNVASTGDSHNKLSYGLFLEVAPTYSNKTKFSDNPNEWYLKSANEGNATASYFLGRNILNGNKCSIDAAQGAAWLLKSARSGLADAQFMIAVESFSGARVEKNEEKGLFWLAKSAATSFIPAKLKYAWILSTHVNQEKRNGRLAAELINSIEDEYLDKQTLYQTRAAVAAENGNFADAVKWQNKAIEDAKDLKIPFDYLEEQLAKYHSKQPWREEI